MRGVIRHVFVPTSLTASVFHMIGMSESAYRNRTIATRPLDLSEEVTHAAPMTTEQIKHSIETRPETNIKFLEKKKFGVCVETWKDILMEGKHLVYTACGHIFCRDCAIRFASEGKRECPLCKKSLAGVFPPFRRLHVPLDPRLKKSGAD